MRRPIIIYGVAVMGFLVPILPRLIIPILVPGPRYYGTLSSLLNDPSGIRLCIWTALPFILLSLLARFLLRDLTMERVSYYQRAGGIILSATSAFILGFIIHIPETAAGVNFGIVFFPFYAIVVMPVGYLIGVVIGRYIAICC